MRSSSAQATSEAQKEEPTATNRLGLKVPLLADVVISPPASPARGPPDSKPSDTSWGGSASPHHPIITGSDQPSSRYAATSPTTFGTRSAPASLRFFRAETGSPGA
jgi:hypothetical protein